MYDGHSGQREIFEACVRPLLVHALRGENVSIFAYGPTGAGEVFDLVECLQYMSEMCHYVSCSPPIPPLFFS